MSNSATQTATHSPSTTTPRFNRVPRSTYRLQLRSGFGFEQAEQLVPYLQRLGISDLYLSPLFRAREESEHGYDVVDHSQVEPAFGDMQSFRQLATAAQQAAMGMVLDIVPNHMGINDPGNLQWNDVLENGPAAKSANYFDIDWQPPGVKDHNRVLLPFLGKPFGETLEAGELKVCYEVDRFNLAYFERRFPLTPSSWPPILAAALQRLSSQVATDIRTELESIHTQLSRLPARDEVSEAATEERYREQFVARRRLASLMHISPDVQRAIESAVSEINGQPGQPRSYDALEQLLHQQHYRLAFWRVAVDEINYRRFFDINDLAAIRVEFPEVFETVHKLTFELLREGLVTGLRIDHPDGLLDPMEYFKNLQSTYQELRRSNKDNQAPLYIAVEKILSGDEQLPREWPISGTTGYQFLNRLSAVLVDPQGIERLQELYPRLAGVDMLPRDVAYHGKLTILHEAMASELFVLASRLFRLARANRQSYDFTLPVLLRGLREVIACFAVYRTYTRPQGWEVSNVDHGRIKEAVRWAKRRNPTMPWSALDYISSVLLLEFPPDLDDSLKAEWRQLAVRLQQVTGPVTAKGIEDTAFYRYYPLVSMNEVGAELGSLGSEPDEFHRSMLHRCEDWPAAMSATATHDTKRGEDVRARLHVLSEIPDEYATQLERWNTVVQPLLTQVDGQSLPDANSRYFIHQTLLGTWPVGDDSTETWQDYPARMLQYFEKAFREAKLHTSWVNPSESFEQAVKEFVNAILENRRGEAFQQLDALATQIAGAGFVNSLAQVVLKSTLPGFPDFYQGCEFWNFRLVDPDNRQPVDYDARSTRLAKLQAKFESSPQQLLDNMSNAWDDELKLFVTARVLDARRVASQLFAEGNYQALEVQGECASHLLAFARQYADQQVIVLAPRLPYGLLPDARKLDLAPLHAFTGDCWKDTFVQLPENFSLSWSDHLSGSKYQFEERRLPIAKLFGQLPMAVLLEGGR